jgi:flagellar export protein FliJ
MITLDRISRLLAFFERKREEKALILLRIRKRIHEADQALADLGKRCEEINRGLVTRSGSILDVERIKITGAFKAHLHSEMERARGEIASLNREERERRKAVEEALKEHKIWEKVKERRENADRENEIAIIQQRLDTLSMQKKHREREPAARGSNRREKR